MRFSGIMASCKLCEFMRKNMKESGARKWV